MDTKDYDRLMQANIARVFNERDEAKRLAAIAEIYAKDAGFYEPETEVHGHEAISHAVTELQASLPPGVSFTPNGPALGHHDVGRLRWHASAAGGPVIVNGMDVAHFKDGRIQALYVFIEPSA